MPETEPQGGTSPRMPPVPEGRDPAGHAAAGEELARALRFSDRALAAAGLEPAHRMRLLGERTRLMMRAGRHIEAVPVAEELCALARELGEDETLLEALLTLGSLHERLADYDQAAAVLGEAHERALAVGDRRRAGRALNSLGIVWARNGDDERAVEDHLAALDLFEDVGDQELRGRALNNLGICYRRLGRLQEARRVLDEAAGTWTRTGHPLNLALTMGNVAQVEADARRPQAAEAAFLETLELLQEAGDRFHVSEVLRAYAQFQLDQGRAAEAADNFRAACRQARETGARREESEALLGLAAALRRLGRWKEACEFMEQGYELAREINTQAAEARIRQLSLELRLHQLEREREHYRDRSRDLARANAELRRLHGRLHRESHEDPLTGLYNRRHLDQALAAEIDRSRRFGHSLSVAMCDLDGFKQINDRFSHAVGDEVLRSVAAILRDGVRTADWVARYGGEEFVVVLVETPLEDAAGIAEKLRRRIAAHPWQEIHPELRVTISIGLSGLEGHEHVRGLLDAADQRLYRAKIDGKDRVCI